MKKFLFISDFDGTISEEDFYKKIMYRYTPEKEQTYYRQFKEEKIKDIDFLNEIFNTMNLSEEEIDREIFELLIDPYFEQLVEKVGEMKGDFIILSAGCGYYIDKILRNRGLQTIQVFTNKGIYKDKGIWITPDQESQFYSERYGIDKETVVKYFRERYEVIAYAGDSEPDYKASLSADIRFAKTELINLYKKNQIEHIAIKGLQDIEKHLDKLQKEL